MPLFVVNASTTLAHGVYAIDTTVPAVVQAIGTDTVVMAGQLPWGPSQKLTYPGTTGAALQQFAPAGMNRLGSAYLSLIRKGWPTLGIVRVADLTAVAATALIHQGGTTVCTVTAIATGSQGNSIICTVGAASDGNANHFNLVVSVSGASGTTSETYPNANFSGTGANFFPSVAGSVLITSVVFNNTGIPTAGNTTMSGGTDGTVTANSYVGTPGANDLGFALLEADDTISHVFTDDSGNSLRATVNAGLQAHVDLLTNRIGYLNGNSGQSAASAQTDVANYRSIRIVYVDPWANISDDTTGALQLMPSSSWAASVAAQLPPSTSIAWKDDRVSALLNGIASLEANRSGFRAQNNAVGISTLIPRKRGGFAFEAGLNTSLTAGFGNLTRTRMGIYMAASMVNSWQPFVDGPNIPAFQQELLNSADNFLGQLKQNSLDTNAAFLPYIINYAIASVTASNTTTFIQGGNFAVNAQVQLGSSMSRIYLNLNYGESVTVYVQ